MGGFCPPSSVLFDLCLQLEPRKFTEGLAVKDKQETPNAPATPPVGESDQRRSREPLTITASGLGEILAGYSQTHSFDIYFPQPRSNSPDILIVPPLQGRCVIIGVQVKCLKQGSNIGPAVIKSELEKFDPIVVSARCTLPGVETRGVLFMCATGKYDKGIMGEAEFSKIWKSDATNNTPYIEVILINLGTPEKRKTFFNKAMVDAPDPAVIGILEQLIASAPA
jgi:hypothetical protein